ncbi:hypothetical protein EXIGLDRAFT_131411 [Exidia glandulosa HHB12029]|uniref:Uncharacterized protein n=1 Tax=Exidia glandulosa HHB12029 TaxID=1314781 RepID=A0A165G351_EXIGL|nr:hypothetical protein EXIGLDRAFT_131411 [Exidia glandulosa HHB12029]
MWHRTGTASGPAILCSRHHYHAVRGGRASNAPSFGLRPKANAPDGGSRPTQPSWRSPAGDANPPAPEQRWARPTDDGSGLRVPGGASGGRSWSPQISQPSWRSPAGDVNPPERRWARSTADGSGFPSPGGAPPQRPQPSWRSTAGKLSNDPSASERRRERPTADVSAFRERGGAPALQPPQPSWYTQGAAPAGFAGASTSTSPSRWRLPKLDTPPGGARPFPSVGVRVGGAKPSPPHFTYDGPPIKVTRTHHPQRSPIRQHGLNIIRMTQAMVDIEFVSMLIRPPKMLDEPVRTFHSLRHVARQESVLTLATELAANPVYENRWVEIGRLLEDIPFEERNYTVPYQRSHGEAVDLLEEVTELQRPNRFKRIMRHRYEDAWFMPAQDFLRGLPLIKTEDVLDAAETYLNQIPWNLNRIQTVWDREALKTSVPAVRKLALEDLRVLEAHLQAHHPEVVEDAKIRGAFLLAYGMTRSAEADEDVARQWRWLKEHPPLNPRHIHHALLVTRSPDALHLLLDEIPDAAMQLPALRGQVLVNRARLGETIDDPVSTSWAVHAQNGTTPPKDEKIAARMVLAHAHLTGDTVGMDFDGAVWMLSPFMFHHGVVLNCAAPPNKPWLKDKPFGARKPEKIKHYMHTYPKVKGPQVTQKKPTMGEKRTALQIAWMKKNHPGWEPPSGY